MVMYLPDGSIYLPSLRKQTITIHEFKLHDISYNYSFVMMEAIYHTVIITSSSVYVHVLAFFRWAAPRILVRPLFP